MIDVIHGNCLEVIPKLGEFNFCFLDPPFNINQQYLEYSDNLPEEEYRFILRLATLRAWDSCTGVMCLHGPDELVKLWLKMEDAAGMTRINWVNWYYDFGQNNRHNFTKAREHCLIYGREGHTFNPDAVTITPARASKYNDKRASKSKTPGKRLPGTVWGLPQDGPNWGRVMGNSKERISDCPNQLPENYLARLIKAYTNPGDRCLDPFGGTGTTAVVANALDRDCVTIDIGKTNVDIIKKRIEKGAIRDFK